MVTTRSAAAESSAGTNMSGNVQFYPIAGPTSHVVEVFPNIFVVSGKMNMFPLTLARNMQIVRQDKELAIINSVRVPEEILKEIDALGQVKHVIKICTHGVDDAFYVERYGATLWSAPTAKWNSKYGSKELKMDKNITEGVPFSCMTAISFDEATRAAIKHKDVSQSSCINIIVKLADGAGVLLSSDMVQNYVARTETEKISDETAVSTFTGVASGMMGFKGRVVTPWLWMQTHTPGGPKTIKHEIEKVLAADWKHLVPNHGPLALETGKQDWIISLQKWYGKDWYVQK